MDRNTITNVEEKQITDFEELKNFIITNNKLTETSLDMLKNLRTSRADIKLDFDEVIEPNLAVEGNEEFFWFIWQKYLFYAICSLIFFNLLIKMLLNHKEKINLNFNKYRNKKFTKNKMI